METLYELIVVLHLVSWAIVIGGWLTHMRTRVVVPGMFHGAASALLTGIVLLGLWESTDARPYDGDPNHVKLGVKLVIALVVTVLAFVGQKQAKQAGAQPSAGLFHAVGALALVNVFIAVLW
ncbi:hypothetical protein [Aeromicrobium sp. IC_218]|uniref:hypothetical protein n=1 Tax=Aeromicrobium sp. IC_218 TaxID=2545468 RepID=UPI00103E866E|nr:hypothetical protein [Aeromicrobium sp. IC_218]TCI98749.1 hypothetical protein E0W78_10320 [Aeromicrobium sp. IC_218]